ncbi:hypothetical protein [Methylobacter sp. sgz302048]|uniref:hypothetical protein n=1 Tax=Methylobacter sp. sgz302048 TaxID=3455945 RepID=UPI003FA00B1C
MDNCNFLDIKDVLFTFVPPFVQWFVREMMGKPSKNIAEDIFEAVFNGVGILLVIYLIACD